MGSTSAVSMQWTRLWPPSSMLLKPSSDGMLSGKIPNLQAFTGLWHCSSRLPIPIQGRGSHSIAHDSSAYAGLRLLAPSRLY